MTSTHRGLAVLLIAFALVAAACSDDDASSTTAAQPATTVAPPPPSSVTTQPPATTAPPTSVAPSTTAASATTVPATTTTTIPFPGDTSTKTNTTSVGSPGAMVDLRFGEHPGFSRIVFDFDGDGIPIYTVGYVNGPIYGGGNGNPYDPAGSANLSVEVQPATAFWITQSYFGPTQINPGMGSVVEVLFVEDFEAVMQWAIGVDGAKPFNVFTLNGPQRLVIDIAD